MRVFESGDGIRWGVEATMPGTSNMMIVFHHPDGRTARRDRYSWYIANGPEARNVVGRLNPAEILERLTTADLARLFRRSMLISAADSPLHPPVTHA